MMNRITRILVAIALMFVSFSADAQKVNELTFKQLFDTKQFFKLRDLYDKHAQDLSPNQRQFYLALLDNIFNRSAKSNAVIDDLLSHSGDSLSTDVHKQLLLIRADNFIKLSKYSDAAACFEKIIKDYRRITDKEEMADLENSRVLWTALKAVPEQEVQISLTSTVMCKRDRIGLIQVPITHGNDTTDMVFDTGANLSVISASAAKKMGMRVVPVNVDLASGTTGQSLKSSLAVADSLFLGDILIRHAVFLLLPDEMLASKTMGYQQYGILGEPVIAQLKEVTIRKDGTLTVSHQPEFKSTNNLALDGLMPIAELTTLQDSLAFRFDTGASSSILYKSFFDRYRSYVLRNGVASKTRTAGVGGTVVESDSYTLTNFTLGINRHQATMSRINVRATPLTGQNEFFFGNLGQDLLRGFASLRINFENMFVDVE